MIELIFAIVIIAISVMSLPMMTQITSKAMDESLIQEAIFASTSELILATEYIWDENSKIGSDLSRVLNLNGNCFASGIYEAGIEINQRVGHVKRRCHDNLGRLRYSGVNYQNSLETLAHFYTPLYVGIGVLAYKKEYDSQIEVIRCDTGNCQNFGLENNNVNLKEMKLSIRAKDDTANEVLVLLRAYRANIGKVTYASKFL